MSGLQHVTAFLSLLSLTAAGGATDSVPVGVELDALFARAAPGALEAEWKLQSVPTLPFIPFSPSYVKAALAEPTNWTAKGAVTPVKNQGPHGYCGTFGRVGSVEGQWFLKGPGREHGGNLVSFSEEELVDCIGWSADQSGYFTTHGFMTTADYPYNLRWGGGEGGERGRGERGERVYRASEAGRERERIVVFAFPSFDANP